MNKKPKVSIIIPTFCRAHLLSRAIISCQKQTYKNIEIVVIDDNFSESMERKKTESVMDKFIDDKRVKYIKLEKNGGASIARNIGIKKCSGSYVTFLDDDDEYLENNIEKQVEFMLRHDLDVVFCDLMFIDDINKTKIIKKYKKNFEYTKEGLLKKHLIDIISGGIAFMYKKEVLIEIGGFVDIPASQEYILMFHTILGGYNIKYYEFVGAIGHLHSSKDGITGSEKVADAKKQVLKIIKPYLYLLKYSDQRKVKFRLYLFISINYLKNKNISAIYYIMRLFPYLDLLLKKMFERKNKPNEDGIIYV